MTLSVADPDLHLYEGECDEWFDQKGRRIERSVYSRKWIDNPSAESRLEITLKGRWALVEGDAEIALPYKRGRSTLQITCHEAATRELKLQKIR